MIPRPAVPRNAGRIATPEDMAETHLVHSQAMPVRLRRTERQGVG